MAKFHREKKTLRHFKPVERTIPTGIHSFKTTGWSDDGRAVAKINQKTVFIKGALPEEEVEAAYVAVHKNYDEAKTICIKFPSTQRVIPQCDYYENCGGCNLQHASYQHQLIYKQDKLKRLFLGIDNSSHIEWQSPLFDRSYNYRHRARLAVKADRNGCVIGFRQRESHLLVDIDRCSILHTAISHNIPLLKELISTLTARSQIVELSITEDSTHKQGVILFCKRQLPDEDLSRIRHFSTVASLEVELWLINSNNNEPLWSSGNGKFEYMLPDYAIVLQFSLSNFTQINPAVNRLMINRAIEWLHLDEEDNVADFYCGIGNFSLAISRFSRFVIGYEGVSAMTKAASLNACSNNISNALFKMVDLNSPLSNTLKDDLLKINKVVLDPPRAGAEDLCRLLVQFTFSKILYISCNPKTLLRDAKILLSGGYRLDKTSLVDMFPQTDHAEVISLFVRQY
jgi:23S rRNA (uracil1939-C5)-methyltransferase